MINDIKKDAQERMTKSLEALARNLADTIRWAKEASWQLDFYRDSRQPAEKPEGDAK